MTSVSVVILNYNYARFLPTAIASALDQTEPAAEVIVVDDGSTDESRAVLESYGPAVRPIYHEVNRGQGAAINTGFDAAEGEVIWFLDADDAILPSACATVAAAFEAHPTMAKFHTPLAVVDGEGRWNRSTLPGDPARLADGDLRDHVFRFRAHGWPPMSGNAYSARVLSRVLPVPAEAYRQAADSFLNEQVSVCGPIVRSDEPVAAYRRHGENQFAGRPVTLDWLRTKIERELCSHERLGLVARQLGLDGYRPNPDDVADVALFGYRLASLRLDPAGHPQVDPSRPDRRWRLVRRGIRAAFANPELATADGLLRSAWFVAIGAAPDRVVRPLLAQYLPDGPSEPVWRRRRREPELGEVLVRTPSGSELPEGEHR
ncbi:MAG: glycosyltransferase family 2 protein [Acidimicrobiales bacterium]